MNDRFAQKDLRGLGRLPGATLRSAVSPLLSGGADLLDEPDPEDPSEELEELDAETDAAYDAAITRAFQAARSRGQLIRREQAKVGEALAVLEEKGLAGFAELPWRLRGLAGYFALLDRSWALRHDDPVQMVDFALLATVVSRRLSAKRYGDRTVKDFQCRAWIDLGNAYRAADRLSDAGKALGNAAALYQQGTGDEQLQARLFDVQASLYASSRHFEAAREALDVVCEIHQRNGDPHLAGRALISKGIYTGYAGKTEEAIRLLRQGLRLVDESRDPGVAFAGFQSQARFLIDLGRFREARVLLLENFRLSEAAGGRVNLLKLRWLEAQLNARLGKLDSAVRDFLEVKSGLDEVGLPYKASLATLELAEVYVRQGRPAQAQSLVEETIEIFTSLGIYREALAALLLLQKAFEQRLETTHLLRTVIDFLTSLEDDPALSFQDWFLGP